MKLRTSTSPTGPGRGLGVSGAPGPLWTPADLGAALNFLALADPTTVTLSSGRVLGLADSGVTAGLMTADVAGSLLYDTSELLNGHAALRTDSTAANLFVATGGTTGTAAFHLAALVRIIAQPDASHQDATFMLVGDPGSDGAHKNSGIGALNALNGAWLYAGGQQTAIIRGSTSAPGAVYDSGIHLLEAKSTGALISLYLDGGFVGSTVGVTSLTSTRMSFCGTYPLDAYGAPDTRIWCAAFMTSLTTLLRVEFLKWIKRTFTFTPKRFISVTGDSITQGNVANASTTSYVALMRSQYATAGETVYILNAGISSQTSAQIAARSPSSFADYYAPLGSNFREEWLCINGGKNDNISTVTPAQTYANLASISVAAQALGVRTVMSTAFYGTPEAMTPTIIAWVDALNVLIRANSCGADKVCDFMLDALVATPTRTHWPDDVHPDDVVLAVMAARMRATIDG